MAPKRLTGKTQTKPKATKIDADKAAAKKRNSQHSSPT
jgi:hypothetical protein